MKNVESPYFLCIVMSYNNYRLNRVKVLQTSMRHKNFNDKFAEIKTLYLKFHEIILKNKLVFYALKPPKNKK